METALREWWIMMANTGRVVLVANVILFAVGFRRMPREVKMFGLFLLMDAFTELMLLFFFKRGSNNMPWLHLYTIMEFLTLSFFYKTLFKDSWLFRKYFWWVIPLVVLLLIGNSVFIESIYGFNSNAKTVVQLFMIGYAVAYFFMNFGVTDFNLPRNFAVAMINAAIMIYYSGTLFIFMFARVVNTPENKDSILMQIIFWTFNAGLFLLFQLFILIGLWKIIHKPATMT